MKTTKALRATATVATLAWATQMAAQSAPAKTPPLTPVEFAAFTIAPSATDYTFTSTPGAVYTGGLFTTSTPITFRYEVANGYDAPNTSIAALLTITSVVKGRPTSTDTGGGTFFDSQNLQTVSMRITLASDPTVNLLSFSNANGTISGFDQDTSGRTSGTAARGGNVAFTSKYLNFLSNAADTYQYSFTTVTPAFNVTTDPITGLNSLDSFTASGPGSFASLVVTPSPEPSALVSLSVLGGCLALGITARRKANSC